MRKAMGCAVTKRELNYGLARRRRHCEWRGSAGCTALRRHCEYAPIKTLVGDTKSRVRFEHRRILLLFLEIKMLVPVVVDIERKHVVVVGELEIWAVQRGVSNQSGEKTNIARRKSGLRIRR